MGRCRPLVKRILRCAASTVFEVGWRARPLLFKNIHYQILREGISKPEQANSAVAWRKLAEMICRSEWSSSDHHLFLTRVVQGRFASIAGKIAVVGHIVSVAN